MPGNGPIRCGERSGETYHRKWQGALVRLHFRPGEIASAVVVARDGASQWHDMSVWVWARARAGLPEITVFKEVVMYDLVGKVAVVTGVGRPRGIGRATALRLAREGARLVLADLGSAMEQTKRDVTGVAPDLARVAAEVETAGAEVLAVPTDISVPAEVDQLLQQAVDHFGRIDIMVCNAAILPDRDIDLMALSAATFSRVLAVNLTGTFLCAQSAARHMMRQGHGGNIITIGSRAARRGSSNLIAYSSSKFGVIGLTQSLALALAPYGIRVNCVCPGAVDTDMATVGHEQLAAQLSTSLDEAKTQAAQEIPLGRLTTPEDLAKAIVWFASSESDHLTGQALNVNGGSLMN